ncbi:MAG: sugar nucleotide-binding protein [Solirubrobacteraceae bacterium]
MGLFLTGATGYLGSEVARQAASAGWTVGPATRVEIRDASAVREAMTAERPDAVIHTAYRQDGDAAEATNVDGSLHVASAAREHGARLVHVSSDVIFRGAPGRPLTESDRVNPITDYGRTKAAAEVVVTAADPGAVIVRTSMIYSGPGATLSRHEALALAAARGEADVSFFEDEIRCPVALADLAAALIELAGRPEVSGPLHVAGTQAVSRLDFAELVARHHGLQPGLLRSARRSPDRPGDLTLDCTRAATLLDTRLRGVSEVLAPR